MEQTPVPIYLLDTSAVRFISGERLAEKASDVALMASPFCFWEIASHLQDEGDFARIKANLMKFRHLKVLNEPTASAEHDLALAQIDVDDSLEARDVIYAALAALRASNSIEEFFKCRIRDGKGVVRQLDGCVARIQEMLAHGESGFKDFIANVRQLLTDQTIVLDTPDDYHASILDLTNGWWIQVKERTDLTDGSYRNLIRRGYFFYAYVLYRSADYAVRRCANIDMNDFEDAKLLLHLSIDDDVTVLTSDKDLRKCLQETVDTLNGLGDDWYKTNVKVCDTQSFLVGNNQRAIDTAVVSSVERSSRLEPGSHQPNLSFKR